MHIAAGEVAVVQQGTESRGYDSFKFPNVFDTLLASVRRSEHIEVLFANQKCRRFLCYARPPIIWLISSFAPVLALALMRRFALWLSMHCCELSRSTCYSSSYTNIHLTLFH